MRTRHDRKPAKDGQPKPKGLTLTRFEGQGVTFRIDNEVVGHVSLAEIRGDRARLTFDFPRDVQIDRSELLTEEES